MRALRWYGSKDVRVENVPEPTIQNDTDALIRVTSTAICGSDLHLYNGYMPTMEKGDILGHEFMGEVVAVGSQVEKLNIGDRVIVPFAIACGHCRFCRRQQTALCENTNPEGAEKQRKLYGVVTSGLFGYSHMYGGYPGGQAEFVCVPHADVGPFKVPDELPDERVLFMTDILPTAWMAVENANVQPGSTVAVWGCGPVGLLSVACAWAKGAERVMAIDEHPDRLAFAYEKARAEVVDFTKVNVVDFLRENFNGGPDCCIDAVGLEAHGEGFTGATDRVKQAVMLQMDRATVLRQAIHACGKGGHVSVPGVYAGPIDTFPFGDAFTKGITLKMGQTHVHRYLPTLLKMITEGALNPDFVISHRLNLNEAAAAYKSFAERGNGYIKVVMKP